MRYKYLPAIAGVTLLTALALSVVIPRSSSEVTYSQEAIRAFSELPSKDTNLTKRLTINDLMKHSTNNIGYPTKTISY